MLRLSVLCVILVLFGSAEGAFRQICEGRSLTIACRSGRVLRIHYASYGRHDRGVCANGGPDANAWCYTDRSLTVVRNACAGRQSCNVEATNSKFGDPCPGTVKYLDLAFGCAPSATPSPLLVRVCEGRSQVISCPVTKRINIQYANYGRLTGGHICPGPIGTIRCQATGSLTKVRDDCQGRAMCQLVSNNSKFGDPCYGTYKYLEVRYLCQ